MESGCSCTDIWDIIGEDDSMWNNNSDEFWVQALDADALDNVSGGAGSGSGTIESDGAVTGWQGNGVYQVDVNGQTITAVLSGKMRMNFIKVQPGDRVRVEYSPDNMRGRITYRYK